jgi:signal transduction histidine kinase
MNFNDYSVSLLVTGLAALIMSAVIFRRNGDAVKQFSYISFGISIWSIAYAFELSSPNYDQMIFWLRFEYLGVAFLPAMWTQFIVKFIGKSHWLSFKRNILLYLIPCITYVAVLTNDYHHLHYSKVSVDNLGPFPLLEIEVGPIYILHTIFFYINLILGLYLLINKFLKADKVYRRQNYVIILGALIPWFINILYLFGFRPYNHIDLTPYAFLTTSLVIGFGLLQLRLFDIIPVARDKIIEDLAEGVLVLDGQDRAVDFNSKLRNIIEVDLKSDVNIGDFYPNIFKEYQELVLKVTEREKSIYELPINNKCYEITITPLFDKSTIYSGVILIHRDVTERKASEELLKQQSTELLNLNQLKDKMFSIIAHDLRVPIMNLKEIMSLFDQKLISDEELKSHLPIINKEIKTTSTLLENLLYWSRTQLKGERINPDYLNLRLVSIVQLNLLESQIREKDLFINNNISENVLVYADKNMVELVIRNLISNAVKYCNPKDSITLRAKLEQDRCVIEIEDTGIGIEEQNISKLFGMNNFSTIGTNAERGTGIGLLLCKEFVEKNKGSIWVRSEFGKGSTFGFSLPVNRHGLS